MTCESEKFKIVCGYGDGSTEDGRQGKVCGFDKRRMGDNFFDVRIKVGEKENLERKGDVNS